MALVEVRISAKKWLILSFFYTASIDTVINVNYRANMISFSRVGTAWRQRLRFHRHEQWFHLDSSRSATSGNDFFLSFFLSSITFNYSCVSRLLENLHYASLSKTFKQNLGIVKFPLSR